MALSALVVPGSRAALPEIFSGGSHIELCFYVSTNKDVKKLGNRILSNRKKWLKMHGKFRRQTMETN